MNNNKNCFFEDNKQVQGIKLPEYLDWATGNHKHEKPLKLPPIQRGFIWRPRQIVDLWDSLLRGMPIGSMIVTKLTKAGCDLTPKETRETKKINNESIGLLDGQQRTLAMMIGWPFSESNQHCLWIDLAEDEHVGSLFRIRLTTMVQPFGFDHISHGRLSRYERKKAREAYNEKHKQNEKKPDYELFSLNNKSEQPRPWKVDGNGLFVRIKDLWEAFRGSNNDESAFSDSVKLTFLNSPQDFPGMNRRLNELYKAFTRLESLEVPLILVPEHISTPRPEALATNAANQLILLFERIGRNGSSLSADDLLFSMIKQQWPEAQDLVNAIHKEESRVKMFMGTTDYVMTAFRLAAAQYSDSQNKQKIADIPRPNPGDFHRHLSSLLGEEEDTNKPLRNYLKNGSLTSAFSTLYKVLEYQGNQDIGLPAFMMPHLSRGLIQVLLRWIMLNSSDNKVIEDNRQKIVSFTLFWYLNNWHEDKASKKAFEIIGKKDYQEGTFPASDLYNELIKSDSEDEIGLVLPILPYERLEQILYPEDSTIRTYDEIFKKNSDGQYIAKLFERELYKRFCWWRKPVLLWLQRGYVKKQFESESKLLEKFAGFTDEDTVPYDFDHLCPQKHWGEDWRNVIKIPNEDHPVIKVFKAKRHHIGNCIGNLHILESSLNRSYGDAPLALKLKEGLESENELEKWHHEDSSLYHCGKQNQSDEHKSLWEKASPYVEDESDKKNQAWDEVRVQSFKNAVYRRAEGLYRQYYEACKHIK